MKASEYKAAANYSKRTFTIRTREFTPRGWETSKYRTIPMSREEFEDNLYNTEDHWYDFLLRYTEKYYFVK